MLILLNISLFYSPLLPSCLTIFKTFLPPSCSILLYLVAYCPGALVEFVASWHAFIINLLAPAALTACPVDLLLSIAPPLEPIVDVNLS